MKMTKLVYPMAFVLAITLATAGCRNHKPVGVTPIGNGQGPQIGDQSLGTVPYDQNGHIQQANISDFDNMIPDRQPLPVCCFNTGVGDWNPSQMREIFVQRAERIAKAQIGDWQKSSHENQEAAFAAQQVTDL